MEAERGHVDLEVGAVDLRKLAFAHQAQRAGRQLLRIPGRLDRLDDQLAVGVVVEVDERLGDHPHAVPRGPSQHVLPHQKQQQRLHPRQARLWPQRALLQRERLPPLHRRRRP